MAPKVTKVRKAMKAARLMKAAKVAQSTKVMKLKAMKATKSIKAAQSMKATKAMKAMKAKSSMKSVEDPCYLDWVELRDYNNGFGVQAPTLKEPRGMFWGNFVAPNLALFQFVFTCPHMAAITGKARVA